MTAIVVAPIPAGDGGSAASPAYSKHSEFGPIPEDWCVRSVHELEPFITSGSRGWARFYSDFGNPFIRITNVSRESIYLDLFDLKFVAIPEDSAEARRAALKDGDILISITADIGIIGYVNQRLHKPAYINQHLALIRIDPCKADSKFLSYFWASERSHWLFRALTDQGAKAGMSLEKLHTLKFASPEPDEQRAIAAALSDVDALIGTLDKLIAKKRAVKLGTVQQLLTGELRLPGFEGPRQTMRLSELAEVDPECLSANTPSNFAFNYISLEDVDRGAITGWTEHCFDSSPSRARRVLRAGDVAMSTVRPNLMSHFLFRGEIANAICSTGFAVLRPKLERVCPEFLYSNLFTTSTARQIGSILAGSNYPAINRTDVKNIEIPCPKTDEQSAIVDVLLDMDAEITALERRRDKMRGIKRGMAQQLLTGRIRLLQPETVA